MTEIDAYFYQNRIIIKRGKEYKTGEVLLAYLSHDFGDLSKILKKCKDYEAVLSYPETAYVINNMHLLMWRAQGFYLKLHEMLRSLPPYNGLPFEKSPFYSVIDEYCELTGMESGIDNDNCIPLDEFEDEELYNRAMRLNDAIKVVTGEYRAFVEDLLRVQKAFAPFLELVYHRSEFLSNEEAAEVFDEFMRDREKLLHSYDKLQPSGTMTMTYQVLRDDDRPVLCEQYHFTTIGAFLYVELFKGLQNHYLPKRCGYCGRYFLLESAYYSDYCTREIEGMNGKRCRDLGHRKKYADKIKNDPVWLTYSRAYKAHYARFLKKKMTQAEFQVWADYALDLRQQALDGAISFEEYQAEIKN